MASTCGLVVGKPFTNLVINQGINCGCQMNCFGRKSVVNKYSSVERQSFTQATPRYILFLFNENG
jgi:hypothetical protein